MLSPFRPLAAVAFPPRSSAGERWKPHGNHEVIGLAGEKRVFGNRSAGCSRRIMGNTTRPIHLGRTTCDATRHKGVGAMGKIRDTCCSPKLGWPRGDKLSVQLLAG